MKITGYRTLSTVHRWGRSVGDVNGQIPDAVTEVPILVLETDEGVEGVALGPHGDTDRLFPAVEGQDPRSVTALYDGMLRQVFKSGHQGSTFGTIGTLDAALWDLKAKMAGEPLWRLLGGADRYVPGYASGLDAGLDDDELVALYQQFTEFGFTAAKIKGGADPVTDVRRLRLVRDVLAVHVRSPALMLDANETWNAKQAVRHVRTLEAAVDLTWVEEPVRRWDAPGHRVVRDGVRAAVATGENLTGLEQFRGLVDTRAADILQTGSVWGVTHFLRVANLANAYDLPVSPVAYHGNPLAAAATAVPNLLSIEVQNLDQPVGVSVDQAVFDGGLVLGDSPGSGVTVDEAAIAEARAGAWLAPGGPHVRPHRAGLQLVPPSPNGSGGHSRNAHGTSQHSRPAEEIS